MGSTVAAAARALLALVRMGIPHDSSMARARGQNVRVYCSRPAFRYSSAENALIALVAPAASCLVTAVSARGLRRTTAVSTSGHCANASARLLGTSPRCSGER